MFGILATLVALLGLIVAVGNAGYLAMLSRSATQRGVSGGATVEYVADRWKVAGGAVGVSLVGLLLTSGGSIPVDLLGLLLGAGGGVVAKNSLDGTRARFRSLP